MRIIFFLMLFFLSVQSASSQEKPPTQKEMQAQMLATINELNNQVIELEKQLAEAKKNKEDAGMVKGIEDQIAMLKKQVAMMGGVKKSLAGISDKVYEQAGEKETLVPGKDVERIKSIPGKILSDSGLYALIRRIHADVEKLIPAAEKDEAARIYLDVKTNLKLTLEVNNAAVGCWIYGHWEKALWLSGKTCLDDVKDPDNLNNYASFLTMIGAEHAAIPILRYLNNKYPGNSTVLNNMGQAWFGLGDIAAAKRSLDSATIFYPDHSLANLTLSNIYLSRGDSVNAIAALRRSLKNGFTVEKAAWLESLGAELDDDDIDFNYPMEDEDPLGFEPFFDQFPAYPTNVAETPMAKKQWEAFREATTLLKEKAQEEADSAKARTGVFANNMMDSGFNHPVLSLHNSNAYLKAGRKLPLAIKKKTALSIEEVMNQMAEAFHQATTDRLNDLERQRRAALKQGEGCAYVDALNNSYLIRAKAIIDEGSAAMKRVYLQNKKKVHNYIKLTAYSSVNDYNDRMGKFHEEIWQKNQWIYVYTANFAYAYASIRKEAAMPGSCEREEEAPRQTKQLPAFKKPECTYADSIKFPVGGIKEECNTCTIIETKLKYGQNDLPKLEVLIAGAINITSQGPQKEESMDPSKKVIMECNKSGLVKVDRGRPPRKCTVNSNRSRSSDNWVTHGSIGSRLLAR